MTSMWDVGSFLTQSLKEKPVYHQGVEIVCSLVQGFGLDKKLALGSKLSFLKNIDCKDFWHLGRVEKDLLKVSGVLGV